MVGFAYCYIASAPGLVMHAVRRQLIKPISPNQPSTLAVSAPPSTTAVAGPCGIIVVGFGLVVLVALLLYHHLQSSIDVIMLGLGSLLILSQLYLICKEYNDQNNIHFYHELHKARHSDIIDPDSYRHLREHGNAFFIILLEVFFLFFCKASFAQFGTLGLVAMVCLWVMPGALVYFLGPKIESEMVWR